MMWIVPDVYVCENVCVHLPVSKEWGGQREHTYLDGKMRKFQVCQVFEACTCSLFGDWKASFTIF